MASPGYDMYYLNVMAGPSAERAWLIPQRLGERLDSFAFSDLLALPQEAIDNAMALPVPLHRFPA